ncbi:MAG: helix-turn-helix domain-containing protein [Desulfovibrionales bacterium]
MQKKLGERIRTYRENQEMSREDLAARSGQELAFITALEEEDLYPSLGPLLKIARALGVRLGTFLDDEQGEDPCIVRKADRVEELTMHQARNTQPLLSFRSLGKGKTDRHMEPFHITIRPEPSGSAAEPPLSSHEGEEFMVVLSGSIAIRYGQERYVLEPGDSIYINSIVPHHVGCAGPEPAEIHAILYFPR